MGWNPPDGVERWHNQAVDVPTVGAGVPQTPPPLRPVRAQAINRTQYRSLLAPRDSDPEGVQ